MNEPTFKIKTESENKTFGRFFIEPLEQGYGQTLGNALRRVLLTSLPGASITAVSIEGVKHQFTTLPGLKEDVTEFLLNVKKIRVIVADDAPVMLSLTKSGPGVITAADVEAPAGVTVVNPELILGTLADKKSEVSLQLTAQKGYGYTPADENKDVPLGTIPVDALFTPISRVNYRVESTRVGRMTNLDKLVMEIWSDGTISPKEALKQAATILVSYFTQIVSPKTGPEEGEVPAVKSEISDETLRMRIEEFDIPTRIVNALSKGGIETVGNLLHTPKEELMKVKNLGSKSLEVVAEKLKEKNVILTV